MIYYLTSTGNGNSPDGTLPVGAVECTKTQYENAAAWTISNGAVVAATPTIDTRPDARTALIASDRVVIRCYEHGVPMPAEWVIYRAALRTIVAGPATATPLPAMPAYPAGT